MKMTAEMIKNIKDLAEELDLNWDYEFVGVRVQELEFELGAMDHVSHVWDDGEDTGIELDGVSACSLDSLGACQYCGGHVALVCGNSAEYGEDDGELIIRDAEVVKVIC